MTKKKTALQSLIKMLKIELAASEKYHSRSNALEMAIKLATTLIPNEREQIEFAYNIGMDDMGRGEFGSSPEHKDASDYFAQNYE
jgi:hypothetical protein